MNNEWNMVKEFQKAFNHPIADNPTYMCQERAKKRYNWMLEELNEFLDANEIVEQSDAMIDLIYFALGTLVEIGVKPDELFYIVHKANMSKLWEDGHPHYYPDGKTMKPSSWVDPHDALKKEIMIQMKKNNSRYQPVVAENFLCLAATIEMVMKSINPDADINQYAIAESLGVVLPRNYDAPISNVSYSDETSLYGIKMDNINLNILLSKFVSIKSRYIHHTYFCEMNFYSEISEYLKHNCHIICGFSYGELYKDESLIKIGHACIICGVDKEKIEIYDPGPLKSGFKQVNDLDLLISIKKCNGGLLIFE